MISQMQKEYRIELTYRVRARTMQNVEDYLEKVQDNLAELAELVLPCSVTTLAEKVLYWPVRPEEVESLKDDGILTVEKDGRVCVAIREWPLYLSFNDEGLRNKALELLEQVCGVDVFTNIRVVDEYLTEVEPI
jgi:hypothetical protein